MNLSAILNAIESAAPIARAVATILAPGDAAAAVKAVEHVKGMTERAECLAACCVVAFHQQRHEKGREDWAGQTRFDFLLGVQMGECGFADRSIGLQLSDVERRIVDAFWSARSGADDVLASAGL